MNTKDVFLDLYDEYSDAIFRYCLFKIYDRELAMDIMHDSFVKVWKYVSVGKNLEYPRALLYKIANNLIIDHVKKAKQTVSLEAFMEKGFNPSDNQMHGIHERLDAKEYFKLIYKLSDTYREVLLLRYVQGLPVKDIAEVLGVKQNAVSVRINRALKEIRKFINYE